MKNLQKLGYVFAAFVGLTLAVAGVCWVLSTKTPVETFSDGLLYTVYVTARGMAWLFISGALAIWGIIKAVEA